MFGNTGFKQPRTKKEIETMMRLEARSHANECERLASAIRTAQPHSPAPDALDKAAAFIRHFAK